MNFQLGEKEEKLRSEVREFADKVMPPGKIFYVFQEEHDDADWEFSMSVSKKLAQKGWLTMSWPKEYGGMGASTWEQLVYRSEAGYWGIPGLSMGVGGIDWVGPSIIMFGTEEQKKKYLPLIASGEPEGIWCTGYSEPDAGSDFVNIRTQAVKDGQDYIINGQKVWTSAAHRAKWMWLAAVTDPGAAPKTKGLSIIIVDMQSPGIKVRPLLDLTGRHLLNEVFFDDVRVPQKNLVGQENRGWYQLMSSLSFERAGTMPWFYGGSRRVLDELVVYAKEKGLMQEQRIRDQLAERAMELEIEKRLVFHTLWKISKGIVPVYEPSRDKVFNDVTTERLALTGMEMLGAYAQLDPLQHDSRWTRLKGCIEIMYWLLPGYSIGGGTHDIGRNIIGEFGLRLPKSY